MSRKLRYYYALLVDERRPGLGINRVIGGTILRATNDGHAARKIEKRWRGLVTMAIIDEILAFPPGWGVERFYGPTRGRRLREACENENVRQMSAREKEAK